MATSFTVYQIGVWLAKSDTIAVVASRIDHSHLRKMLKADRQWKKTDLTEQPNPPPDALRLDHFLKLIDQSETGGQAKLLIQSGAVQVNGEVETRRRRKLAVGDIVEVGGGRFVVE